EGTPNASVSYSSDAWDWSAWTHSVTTVTASGPMDPRSLTYTPTLNNPTRCGADALPGNYTQWDNQGNWNSFPVTVTADSTLTAGDAAETHTVMLTADPISQVTVKQTSDGKQGVQINGLGGIAATDPSGNVIILIPEGTPVADWASYNQYARSGTMD